MELEEKYLISEDRYMTKKDQTGHMHEVAVNSDGDGKTVTTSSGPEHVHKIFQWMIQPAKGHTHNMSV